MKHQELVQEIFHLQLICRFGKSNQEKVPHINSILLFNYQYDNVFCAIQTLQEKKKVHKCSPRTIIYNLMKITLSA